MENAIKNHNAKILENSNRDKGRNKIECPPKGKDCRKKMSFMRLE